MSDRPVKHGAMGPTDEQIAALDEMYEETPNWTYFWGGLNQDAIKQYDSPKFRGRPVVYIAGPMTAKDGWAWERNIREAEEVFWILTCLGYSCICPHTMGRNFENTLSYEEWISIDLPLLARCDAIYMCEGWQGSRGSNAEHEFAIRNAIEILYTIEGAKRYLSHGGQ